MWTHILQCTHAIGEQCTYRATYMYMYSYTYPGKPLVEVGCFCEHVVEGGVCCTNQIQQNEGFL